MGKLYIRVNNVHKYVIGLLLLIVLFIPKLSQSQTDLNLGSSIASFESPQLSSSPGYLYRPSSSPWSFSGQSGLSRNWTVFTGGNPIAPSGDQVLFLQDNGSTYGPGAVERSFSFGQTGYYRIKFKAAWREGCCSPIKDKIVIRVIVHDGVSNVVVGEFKLKSKNYDQYFTLPLKLPVGSHTVRLESESLQSGADYTGFVDDFGIQMVYELPSLTNWTVPQGSTYVIGQHGSHDFGALKVKGTLVAPQNEDVNILANYILVESSGEFQIGMERSPYLEKATITLNGTDLNQHVGLRGMSGMGTKFLGAMNNGIIRLHGKERVSWNKLRETAVAASSLIKVENYHDWKVGDEIVIAPTGAPSSHENEDYADDYDKRKIYSMSNYNKDITLDAPLSHRHSGETRTYSGNGQTWTADMRAEVGLLTRNIKIQGDGDSPALKRGAHVMIMGNAEAYVSGVELYRVGQSAILGRYPFHWHQRGDASGQYFKNSSVHQSYNRALTIHRTNNTLVEDNVFFDHIGHGIFFEEGNEEGNQILGNLVIGTKRPGVDEDLTPGETINEIQNRAPASYWITHPNNTIEGNVAAGTVGTGFWYIFPHNDLGGQGKHPRLAPFGSFKNNVAHSTSNGFDIYDVLNDDHGVDKNYGYFPSNPNDLIIENCTWYANGVGVYTGVGSNELPPNDYNLPIYAPDDWLVFKNNIFVDNEKALMLASNNQVKNSVFVDFTNLGNAPQTGRSMIHIYDGAGTVSDSHIIGYNTPNGSMLSYAGATYTYGNFRIKNTTRANNLWFNGTAATSKNKRNATVYDEDGSLTGQAGHTIVVDHEFMLLGDPGNPDPEEDDLNGWVKMKRSSRKYVNTRPGFHKQVLENPPDGGNKDYSWFPNVNVVRTGIGNAQTVDYTSKTTPVLPFIMNEIDLLYTYDWIYESGQNITNILPTSKKIMRFTLAEAAEVGDFVIVRFKDMGTLTNVIVDMNSDQKVYDDYIAAKAMYPTDPTKWGAEYLSIPEKLGLQALKDAIGSAYFKDTQNNYLYIKAVTNGELFQSFNIRWGSSQGGTANNSVKLEREPLKIEATELVYPNPASTRLYIKGLAEGEQLRIIDASGRLMETTTYKGFLDVSQLNSGMYIVRTQNGNYRFIKE